MATILEAHNEILIEQNSLITQQVEILRNTNILKGEDTDAMRSFANIEDQKLKLRVKPILWLNGAGYSALDGTLRININNKGEEAQITNLELKSDDINLQENKMPFSIEKRGNVNICGIRKSHKHIKDCVYKIEIFFEDKLQNKYLTTFNGIGANA